MIDRCSRREVSHRRAETEREEEVRMGGGGELEGTGWLRQGRTETKNKERDILIEPAILSRWIPCSD